VDYRGISVSQVKELRVKLAPSGTQLRVVKNSLTERAADQAGVSELKSLLVGPTALAFVDGDAALAAKALSDTNRTLRILDFKGGLMNGTFLSAADVQSIARLPAREVLHGQLVGTIASPLSGLVRTLNALISGLAIQLGQIAEQGLVSGSSAPSAESNSEGGTRPSESDTAAEAETGESASASEAAEAPPDEAEASADATEGSAEAPEVAEAPVETESNETEQPEGASDDAPSDES
jgi:large subunit ribosomal protein L10